MSETVVILVWFGIVGTLGLNGFAAGVAAVLHIWQRRKRRALRAVLAAAVAGLLPASLVFTMALTDRTFLFGEGPLVMALAFAMFFGPSTIIALPGAFLVTRKLAGPGDEYRAFE